MKEKMFSKNYLIIFLFVGSLLSSDTKLKKEMVNKSRFVKGFVIPGLVGTAVTLLSHRITLFEIDPDKENEYLIKVIVPTQLAPIKFFGYIFANLKLIPLCLIDLKKLSFDNGKRMFVVISGLHGLLASAACGYGLNRFFPG